MTGKLEYTWVSGVRDAFLAGDLIDPPAWVRERARQLFETHARSTAASLIERVRASLVFDSRRSGLARAGVRSGAGLEGPWQLLYRGGDVDIDLLVRPNQDGRTLTVRGQAMALGGERIPAGIVEVVPADAPGSCRGEAEPSARSEVEPTGEFALPNLQRGRYDVLVRLGAREIELTNLEL